MSKYNALWEYVRLQSESPLKLTFAQVGEIAGVPLDHSFLNYKKELATYGWQVGKISLKQQTVNFERLPSSDAADVSTSATALLAQLDAGDTSAAYAALQQLEKLSDASNALYPCAEKFAAMVQDKRYAVRVRGFRLLCKQSKWDDKNKLDDALLHSLTILSDSKPTAVRQALAALQEVVRYKPALRKEICTAASAIDCTKYKDSMSGLIEKDVEALSSVAQAQEADT